MLFVLSSDSKKPIFEEMGAEAGLNFWHVAGNAGSFYLPEIMGSGVGLIDFDGDGDLDIILVQGGLVDQSQQDDLVFPLPKEYRPGTRLYRNELIPEGELRFIDVTEKAGLQDAGYGMGVAIGDYDNNGFPDFYLTNLGSNVLYRNNGDGTFTDVTEDAGVDDQRWSTSAAFFDYDKDGDLDLFIANYVDFTVPGNRRCLSSAGELDYCMPAIYRPVPDRLFRNDGNGRFTDVTSEAGIAPHFGPGLGVSCDDFNGDGWIDIYVANDGAANLLWLNRGDGTFEETGLISGTAFSGDGLPEAGMGLATGDYDGDGDPDILVTNLRREGCTLYRNEGGGIFTDVTRQAALLNATFPYTGFGTEWIDYDNDGHLDLVIVNGAVTLLSSLRGDPYPYHQTNHLFRNLGGGQRFEDVTQTAGSGFTVPEVTRGLAVGDLNHDGKIDLVISNNNGPVRVLINQSNSPRTWISIELEGKTDNRSGIGARVGIFRKGEKPQWRRLHSDGSYLSASELRVHFGLGDAVAIEKVEVHWPTGVKEEWESIDINQRIRLVQGTGIKIE